MHILIGRIVYFLLAVTTFGLLVASTGGNAWLAGENIEFDKVVVKHIYVGLWETCYILKKKVCISTDSSKSKQLKIVYKNY